MARTMNVMLLALALAASVGCSLASRDLLAEEIYPDEDTYIYTLPDLPYEYDALEPYIDETTMRIHHDKHHKTYVENLNKAVANYTDLQGLSLLQLLEAVGTTELPEAAQVAIRNNGGGHWNHAFFWTILTPNSTLEPVGELADAIDEAFGSFPEFKAAFSKAAAERFGSGFAWLLVESGTGNLTITSTPNQDNPQSPSIASVVGVPVIGLDVWEHAYYLKYQNLRANYTANFWNLVNWEQANDNYLSAVSL